MKTTDEKLEEQLKQAETIKSTEEIEGSPFMCVEVDEKFFVALGRHRLTELLSTRAECDAWVKDISWNKIVLIASVIMDEKEKFNEDLKILKNEN